MEQSITPELLAAAAGMVVSLFCSYFPAARRWMDERSVSEAVQIRA